MSRKDLANKIWRACDIMRTDDDTTGILEYTEQLSWMIFLKVYDDLETRFEANAALKGRAYERVIGEDFRWPTWTKKDYRGQELVEFIDERLFPYLRSQTGTPQKQMIATIFAEIERNRMRSPFNLKDVIEIINQLDFNDPDDSHTVSQVYEELLLKLGKEGGIAGEFYTPRPIVRLIVKIVNPQIGESILDPFCGSGGFLAESFKLMSESKELLVEDEEILQRNTFWGQEKKPLPYLLGIMNCILHGILTPDIKRVNTLSENIRNIPESQRFAVILTNPPFGGEEGEQIQENFPIESKATEILALQYVMKKLRMGGRCGMVVPEGVLFRGGPFADVKAELLGSCRVSAIISLPLGVFANVTSTGPGPKTNLLFFEKTGATDEIWYYEHVPDYGRSYTKKNPIRDDDLKGILEKWKRRETSASSWTVSMEDIRKRGYDLTAKNPAREGAEMSREPKELASTIVEKQARVENILQEILDSLGENQ